MKNRFLLYMLVFLSVKGFAQVAAWNAVLPANFPVNNSGQINGISRVSQMKFHPTDSLKMYAMSARGGLFITTNGGNNWTVAPGTDFMPYARLASVCIDYTNDSVIYIGTGDHDYYYNGSGVWKSTNGGQTFIQTGLSTVLVVELIMNPANNQVIVAATDSGIFKTYNGGTTWTSKTSRDIEFDDMKKVEFASSQTLFAATTDSILYRSYDFGETWTQLTNGIHLPAGITSGDGCRIALTPADTSLVYLAMVANGATIFKSTNEGNSFTAVKNTIAPYLTYYDDTVTSSTQGDYNFAIGADRTNPNILYLVAQNTWRSLDGGQTWSMLTHWYAKVHTDMHQIIVSPYNSHQLWNMNDGGIWLGPDSGNTWLPKSNGIAGEEIYHGNCSPTRRDMISIGTQDNGELYADSIGWYTNRGGDWSPECAFDYRPLSAMVYYFDDVTRRVVNGSSKGYNLPLSEIKAMAFNRNNDKLAFAADSDIYRTVNLLVDSPSWALIDTFGKPVMAMHSGLADTNRLYVVTNDAKFYTSRNAMSATPVFTETTLPHATNSGSAITSIKGKPGVVYVICNARVYRSADTGTTWANITYNLPNVTQVQILSDEFYPDSELVFVASNDAVYYKTVTQTTWTIFSNSLPSRPTLTDMSVYNDSTAEAILRVAVYGRGMWQVPIAGLRPLQAYMSVNNTTACKGVPVVFSDISAGVVTSRKWQFPGGNPATSNAANPVVTYNAYGIYSATLTVYNRTDSSTVVKNYYISIDAGKPMNLVEGFESDTFPPAGWSLWDIDNDGYNWQWDSTAGAYGLSSACMYFDNYYQDAGGNYNDILTPKYDLTGYNTIQLTFDHAYKLYGDTTEIDSMEILISTDCAITFSPVYREGGAQFATVSGTGGYTSPSPGDWRTDTVNLTSFAGDAAIFDFRNIGHYGNDMFIDNINITATVLASAGRDTTICPGTTVNIGTSAISGLSYGWLPVTGLSSAQISNPVASPVTTTSYVLTATQDSSGISSTATVTVFIAHGDSIYLRGDTLFAAFPASSYQWQVNGNAVPGDTTEFCIITQSGDYSLVSTDSIGCSNISNHILFTGLQQIADDGITVYPDPLSTGNWQVQVSSIFAGSMMQLYDCEGKLVYTAQITNLHSQIEATLASGVYLLRISNVSGTIIKRLVKL